MFHIEPEWHGRKATACFESKHRAEIREVIGDKVYWRLTMMGEVIHHGSSNSFDDACQQVIDAEKGPAHVG